MNYLVLSFFVLLAFQFSDCSRTLKVQNIILTYRFISDIKIEMNITSKSQGYLGIGFGLSMDDAAMILCYFEDGVVKIEDRTSKGHQLPTLDEKQRIENKTGSRNETWTSFGFIREIEKNGQPLIYLDKPTPMLFAWGDTDKMEYHGKHRAKTSLQFVKDPLPSAQTEVPEAKDSICHITCSNCNGPLENQCKTCFDGNNLINSYCKPNKFTIPPSYFTLDSLRKIFFEIANGEITFVFKIPANESLGVGIGSHSMFNQDVIAVEVDGENVQVTDRFAPTPGYPKLDTEQGGNDDIIPIGQFKKQEGSFQFLFAKFKRKLITGDSKDFELSPGNLKFTYAFGKSAASALNADHNQKFFFELKNGVKGPATSITDTLSSSIFLHGLPMLIIWGILADLWAFFPRYLRAFPKYILIHQIFMISYVLITQTFSIFIVWRETDFIWHLIFTKTVFILHFLFAIVVLFSMTVQLFVGSLVKWLIVISNERGIIKKYRNYHIWNGYFLLIFSKVVILFGYTAHLYDPKWLTLLNKENLSYFDDIFVFIENTF